MTFIKATSADRTYFVIPAILITLAALFFIVAGISWISNTKRYKELAQSIRTQNSANPIMAAKWNGSQWQHDRLDERSEHTDRWLRVFRAAESASSKNDPAIRYGSLNNPNVARPLGTPFGSNPSDRLLEAYWETTSVIVDETIELIKADKEFWLPIILSHPDDTLLPGLGKLRDLAGMLDNVFTIEFRKGNFDRSIEILQAIDRISNLNSQPAMVAEDWNSVAIRSDLYQAIEQSCQVDRWNDEQLNALGKMLSPNDSLSSDRRAKHWAAAEALYYVQVFEGGSSIDAERTKRLVVAPSSKSKWIKANTEATRRSPLFRSEHSSTNPPISSLTATPNSFAPDQWLNLPAQGIAAAVGGYPLSAGQLAYFQRETARRHFTQTVIESRRFEREHHRWPKNDGELVKKSRLQTFPFKEFGRRVSMSFEPEGGLLLQYENVYRPNLETVRVSMKRGESIDHASGEKK